MSRAVLATVLWTLAAAPVAAAPAPAPAEPRTAPPRAEPPRDPPPRTKSRAQPRPEPLRPRRVRDARPHKEDAGAEEAVPPLETDPFRPPKGGAVKPAQRTRVRPWFVRPSVLFVARLSKTREFLPKEGFGFGVQAGVTLGRSTLRVSLAVAYHFYRLARTMDITVNDPNLTSCTAIRTLGHHLATGSLQGTAVFRRFSLWAGLRGGMAHVQLQTPTPTCATDSGHHTTGALGPELGFGYGLRHDLMLGVAVAYLHYFSDKSYISEDGLPYRYFYGMITAGAALTLRF